MQHRTDEAGQDPIQQAQEKTREVREDLEVAGAELQLTATVLERAVQPQHEASDVRKAIDQNGAVAESVAEATQDLAEVEALLANEIAERQRLERELEQRG